MVNDTMAMGTSRSSKALHNFTLPCDLRWGHQRFLRCIKVNSPGQPSSPAADHLRSPAAAGSSLRVRGPTPPLADDGIAATREKVMLDLQTAADRMKVALFKDGGGGGLEEGAAAAADRPWNLRTRRAACKMPESDGKGDGQPPRGESGRRSPVLRSEGNGTAAAAAASGEKRERAKFSVPLSKRDVEEDFFAMVGHRPPRRPKKRARVVQRQLDTLFPGLWLTEVTPDMYKVPEAAP